MTLRLRILFASFVLLLPIPIAYAQKLESKDRQRGQIMLDRIKDELKKNYYDRSNSKNAVSLSATVPPEP